MQIVSLEIYLQFSNSLNLFKYIDLNILRFKYIERLSHDGHLFILMPRYDTECDDVSSQVWVGFTDAQKSIAQFTHFVRLRKVEYNLFRIKAQCGLHISYTSHIL
jgi:hypothetical protein